MQRPVTFCGVPGHPFQPAVLWNAGLLFCPVPRCYSPSGVKLAETPGLMRELEGREADALHVEFSIGATFHVPDRSDNTGRQVQQRLDEGRLPIVLSRTAPDGVEWECIAFCRLGKGRAAGTGEEDLLTEVRWTARNTTRRRLSAQLGCHLGAPHVALGYKVKLSERSLPYMRRLRLEGQLLLDDRAKARLAAVVEGGGQIAFHQQLSEQALEKAETPLAELGLATDVLVFRARLDAGQSASVRLVIPYFAVEPAVLKSALRTHFDAALTRTRAYWRRELTGAGGLQTPEPVVDQSFDAYLCQAMIATGRRPRSGHWILKTSPSNYEGLWGAHSAIAAFSMDLRGKHAWSRRVLEAFLANQGPMPESILHLFGDRPAGESEGFSAHPGFLGNLEGHMAVLWAFYHGWIMWAIGEHARLTNDWDWLKSHAGKLALACEWVAHQRRRTKRRDDRAERVLAYGLLPAANAFDWGFGHMFWSDAHTYRGLKEIADCLCRIGHPRGEEFRTEAETYREDIIAAVTRCRDSAPQVPLDDGTTIPFVPMSVEMRDYFTPDWTYAACGPLNLAWAGVVPADHELTEQTLAFLDAGRPLGEWDAKNEKYRGWDWAAQVPADEDFLEATRPNEGRARLWRHKMTYEPGWIPQAFVFMERDDIGAFLEHFYSLISNGGQHVEIRSPVEQRDGVPWTQPGQANLMWLMRDMLVRENGETLILAGTCPRHWLANGEAVAVNRLLTRFGRVSFRLESRVGRGVVLGDFRLRLRRRPKRILLRVRHPEGRIPRSVAINDGPRSTVESEWIPLPAGCRRLEVRY
jgi:hypothetical protein